MKFKAWLLSSYQGLDSNPTNHNEAIEIVLEFVVLGMQVQGLQSGSRFKCHGMGFDVLGSCFGITLCDDVKHCK